ncbi:hypothetical protein TEU_07195 [Thermococcus eurythermalis]|uniref:Uncharacterized protein n=2 Tax=Thermococcus eurythermalis TaxID=1505907 RepID=A0A097QUH6_9EURY|nr:hypothetical protein TEU_07195 [Thermococcus eurythermalis]
MSRKFLVVLILVVIILTPAGYIMYGYSQYDVSVSPNKSAPEHTYIVIKFPDGGYGVFTLPQYVNLTLHGFKAPEGAKGYAVNVTGYITGIPEVDVNLTLNAPYQRFTIIVGDPSAKKCSSNPEEFTGSCSDRTAAVAEISAFVASMFKRYYYLEALKKGMDEAGARQYAYEETMKRHDTRYLSFMTKVALGLKRIGNKEHLAIVLLGPAEGAKENRIIVPRPGLIILEGKSDGALRAEVVLLEKIMEFKWPTENQTSTSG